MYEGRLARTNMYSFIHDSLYNPNYGYFSKQAVIFSTTEGFNFKSFASDDAFQEEVTRIFAQIEASLDADEKSSMYRQLWHTPTELFKVSEAMDFELIIAILQLRGGRVSNYTIQTYNLPIQGPNHL